MTNDEMKTKATEIMSANLPMITRLVEEEGMTPYEALGEVLKERQRWLMEMVEGKTERAKATRQRISDSVWTHHRKAAGLPC